MNWIGRCFRKLALLFDRQRFQSDLDEEMAFHREEAAKEMEEAGMSPQAARIAVARQFGNPTRLKERSNEVIGFRFESEIQDLGFAIRQLRKNPGFAATAVIILGLGIGASIAIFGFVDAALIKPLPYFDSCRLTILFESIPLGQRFHLSYPDYLDWKKQNSSFSSLDVYQPYGFMLKTRDGLQQAVGASVSSGFFHTLGVTPELGRDFYAGEDSRDKPRTVLLTYSGWQKRYGGRTDVLGQQVTLDGQTNTIVGVLPRDFHFAPAEPAEFWAILQPRADENRGSHGLFGVARLKDGVTFETAFADLTTIARRLEKQYPDTNRDQAAFMLPLAEVIVGDIRPILLVLLIGAGLLLLIATVNVASLLLVRSESRRREMAVRGALGASRARLLRQFVTEGLLLAAIGCVLGVICASVAIGLMERLVPKDLMAHMPYLDGVGMNWHLAGFAALIAILTGLVFALTPAMRLDAGEMQQGLKEGGRASPGILWRRFGANLVVIELATAMVLLVGAGLLGKSFYRLLHTDAGLEPANLAMMSINAQGDRYSKSELAILLARQIEERVKALPGVTSVGFTNHLPLGDGDGTSGFSVPGRDFHGLRTEVANRQASAGYFPTLQARMLRGHGFDASVDMSKPRVAIINHTLASKYFAGQDAVGQRISWSYDQQKAMEIIGIVNDLQEGQLDAAPRAALYTSFEQNPSSDFSLVVRTTLDPGALLLELDRTIHQIDPGIAIFESQTMDQRVHDSPAAYLHRASAWMVGWFASVALLLGVVGLYGVVAYSVTHRTREIGVRMALGAPRAAVYGMILKEAGRLIALGVGLGLACSIGASSLMRKLLFGTEAWDVPTLIVVALVLAVSAIVASFIPARRAAKVNPVEALRAE